MKEAEIGGEKEGWGCAADACLCVVEYYTVMSYVSLWTRYEVYMFKKGSYMPSI